MCTATARSTPPTANLPHYTSPTAQFYSLPLPLPSYLPYQVPCAGRLQPFGCCLSSRLLCSLTKSILQSQCRQNMPSTSTLNSVDWAESHLSSSCEHPLWQHNLELLWRIVRSSNPTVASQPIHSFIHITSLQYFWFSKTKQWK